MRRRSTGRKVSPWRRAACCTRADIMPHRDARLETPKTTQSRCTPQSTAAKCGPARAGKQRSENAGQRQFPSDCKARGRCAHHVGLLQRPPFHEHAAALRVFRVMLSRERQEATCAMA